jgi:hypothetical protein
MTYPRSIAEIDKDITAIQRRVRRLHVVDNLSTESWQAAWDREPALAERERELFRERGAAQKIRDERNHATEMKVRRQERRRTTRPIRQHCGAVL